MISRPHIRIILLCKGIIIKPVQSIARIIFFFRREALRKWKDKCGLAATYWNLMKVCIEAGHTQCAEAVCEILKKKCEDHY